MSNMNPGNPYASPTGPLQGGSKRPPAGGKGHIVAPGVALVIFACLGILVTGFNVIFALTQEVVIDPLAPELMQEMQRNSVGATAAAVQSISLLANCFVLFGGICMIRVKNWGVALAASIIAIVNCLGLCCVPGLPIGIWALVILCIGDTKQRMG